MSYIVNFEIPDEWWQGVSHVPGERERARNRASVKRYSRMVWSEAEKSGRAWKAERFCLSLAVQAESEEEFAGDAEEALKSLVDAGSRDGGGVGLWDDDDSSHRLMTCYFRLPSGLGRGRRRVQAGIWEVGKYFDPLHALAASVSKAWAQVPVWKRCPDWKGRVVEWAFPSSLWLTSNYTDTDIACREAEREIGGWGSCRHDGKIDALSSSLRAKSLPLWEDFAPLQANRCAVLVQVRYAASGQDLRADPDNAGHTVLKVLEAGARAGKIPPLSSRSIPLLAFCRDERPGFAGPKLWPGEHSIRLFFFPLPPFWQPYRFVASLS